MKFNVLVKVIMTPLKVSESDLFGNDAVQNIFLNALFSLSVYRVGYFVEESIWERYFFKEY